MPQPAFAARVEEEDEAVAFQIRGVDERIAGLYYPLQNADHNPSPRLLQLNCELAFLTIKDVFGEEK